MRIVITSSGRDLDAPASPVFGRCPTFIFVDTDSMEFEAVDNPAISASGGAGIQAAQFVVERGAQVVLTGNVGPNAFDVFRAAGMQVFLIADGTVREAIEAFKAGALQPTGGANVSAHAGMGHGTGMGRGGTGQGSGWSRPTSAPATPRQASTRREEIAALGQAAAELRQQLASVMERLDKLEKGD